MLVAAEKHHAGPTGFKVFLFCQGAPPWAFCVGSFMVAPHELLTQNHSTSEEELQGPFGKLV